MIFYGKNGIPGVVQKLIEEIEARETSTMEIDQIEALQITKKRFRERCYYFPKVQCNWNWGCICKMNRKAEHFTFASRE